MSGKGTEQAEDAVKNGGIRDEGNAAAQEAFFPLPVFLLPWFYENKRDLPWRKTRDAYAVWVSEIMLQQTRVEAAKESYVRFMRALPTVYDLAACDEEKLMKLWEGLGYYSRARNLKKCAALVVEKYGGVFPSDKELLKKLPGIGEYTAGAVSSIAYDEKNPAIDGNVLRVCARVEGDFTPVDNAERNKELYRKLESVYPVAAGDYTQSLMELGALVCTPDSPRCAACPMHGRCMAEKNGWQGELPVRKKKPEKKSENRNVFVLCTPAGVALRKRPAKGVLAGMWEFANAEEGEDGGVAGQLSALGVKRYAVIAELRHTHVFTHLIWNMTAYLVQTPDMPPSLQAFSLEEVRGELSLASAFRWCLRLLEE